MPYISQGCRTYVYAIREKTGRIQNRANDPYIWIGMSCLKRRASYLHYFTSLVTDGDSIRHQQVNFYINNTPSAFYVSLVKRFSYNPMTSRRRVVVLQNLHNALIRYP